MDSNELQETFLAFREQCIWLQTCFNTYYALYESGDETLRVLSETAPLFFHDLNHILIEYCILQICRLTDSARTFGRDNLTVNHINELLAAKNILTSEISTATAGLVHYRSLIKDSRNWIISHADKLTLLDRNPIGEHAPEEVTGFFKNLYCYIDAVGNSIGVGPLDFSNTSGAGDALDLLRYLKVGLTSGERT